MVFRVLSCTEVTAPVARVNLRHHDRVEIGRGPPAITAEGRSLRWCVDDPWASARHASLQRVDDRWRILDVGAKNGVVVDGVPMREGPLRDGSIFEVGGAFFLFRDGVSCEDAPRAIDPAAALFSDTLSPAWEAKLARLRALAGLSVTLHLLGEAGSVYDAVARWVHAASARDGALVEVLATGGMEPEALSQALRSAHRGTLVIDSPLLLPEPARRVLARTVERAPAASATHALDDVRVITLSTTGSNAVWPPGGETVEVTPLRTRPEDLGLELSRLARRRGLAALRFHPEAARRLLSHRWPGDLGELTQAIELALGLGRGEMVEAEHLPSALREGRPAHAPPTHEAVATMAAARVSRDGDGWRVEYGGASLRVADSNGMRYLAELVATPGVEHAAIDLAALSRASRDADGAPVDLGDAGPLLDPKAREAYRARVEALEEAVREATGWGDRERARRAREELEFLQEELARAVGLGGRDRRAASALERVRVSVTHRLRDAVRALGRLDPVVGHHFDLCVRTGRHCVYVPSPLTGRRG